MRPQAHCQRDFQWNQVDLTNHRSVFLKYDKENKGYFNINDLKRVAKSLGEKVTDETLEEMIKRIDSNMDGKVTLDDFYNSMTKKNY